MNNNNDQQGFNQVQKKKNFKKTPPTQTKYTSTFNGNCFSCNKFGHRASKYRS